MMCRTICMPDLSLELVIQIRPLLVKLLIIVLFKPVDVATVFFTWTMLGSSKIMQFSL